MVSRRTPVIIWKYVRVFMSLPNNARYYCTISLRSLLSYSYCQQLHLKILFSATTVRNKREETILQYIFWPSLNGPAFLIKSEKEERGKKNKNSYRSDENYFCVLFVRTRPARTQYHGTIPVSKIFDPRSYGDRARTRVNTKK